MPDDQGAAVAEQPPQFKSFSEFEQYVKDNRQAVKVVKDPPPDEIPAEEATPTEVEKAEATPPEDNGKPTGEASEEDQSQITKADLDDIDAKFTRRLKREANSRKRLEAENARLHQELAAAKSQPQPAEKSVEQVDDEPYPDRAKYDSEEPYMEDLKLWEEGKPLKHKPTVKAKQEAPPTIDPKPGEDARTDEEKWLASLSPEERQAQLRRVEIINDLLADMDGLEGDDEELAADEDV